MSATTPPEKPRPDNVDASLGFIGRVAVPLGTLLAGGLITYFGLQFLQKPVAPPGPAQESNLPRRISETDFQANITKNFHEADVLAEWRAARSDHKIIALAVASCHGIGDASHMTRDTFAALRLDLRPDENHYIEDPTSNTAAASTVGTNGTDGQATVDTSDANKPGAPQPIKLTGYEQTMIVLSDAVARARLAAADGASSNYPNMKLFGWYTVLISGLATLCITLKSSMNPRQVREPGKPVKWGDLDTYRNGWIVALGVLAIGLSTAGTVLTGVKQFYDPTGAYQRNATALVSARQLHQEIALTFIRSLDDDGCGLPNVSPTQIERWSVTMAGLQEQTLKAAVSLPGLDGNQNAKNQLGRQFANPQQPAAAAAPGPAGDQNPVASQTATSQAASATGPTNRPPSPPRPR